MDHHEFSKYHNRHIQFSYKGKKLSGVVMDLIPFNRKKNGTDYILIPTEHLEDWKNAPESIRKKLEQTIDIRHVTTIRDYDRKTVI